MNTKHHPPLPSLSRNLKAHTAIVCLAASLSAILPVTSHAMEAIDALNGITPMNTDELEESYGGFRLPSGINVNIGIATDISVNGELVVHNYYSSGRYHHHAHAENIKASASVNVEHIGTTTKIYQASSAPENQTIPSPGGNTIVTVNNNPLTGNLDTIISNSANNAVISQVQKITVDISNYAAMLKQQAASALSILKAQAGITAINAIR